MYDAVNRVEPFHPDEDGEPMNSRTRRRLRRAAGRTYDGSAAAVEAQLLHLSNTVLHFLGI